MRQQIRLRSLYSLLTVMCLLLSGVLGLAWGEGEGEERKGSEAFDHLTAEPDIIYLLANSSVIMGPDVRGQSEDITFTGVVSVPKFPQSGFERRQLPSGRYQIDFELTRSELQGESYLLQGPVHLGEHPELRSLGTITQRRAGQDYPADFIVQRKVLIRTPKGVMYNEEAVPVRGTIDSIPPVRDREHTKTSSDLNVFRGRELPVALLDVDGNVAGWFYSRVHLAFAIKPAAIYRAFLKAEVNVKTPQGEEAIALEGPVEMIETEDHQGVVEVVKAALRGTSELLGGEIMFTEAFHQEARASIGKLAEDTGLKWYFEIKTPGENLEVEAPILMKGDSLRAQQVDEVLMGSRTVPVFHVALEMAGEGLFAITDEAGKSVGHIAQIDMISEEPTGRRPCCPLKSEGGEN